jgi:hypothetical protein
MPPPPKKADDWRSVLQGIERDLRRSSAAPSRTSSRRGTTTTSTAATGDGTTTASTAGVSPSTSASVAAAAAAGGSSMFPARPPPTSARRRGDEADTRAEELALSPRAPQIQGSPRSPGDSGAKGDRGAVTTAPAPACLKRQAPETPSRAEGMAEMRTLPRPAATAATGTQPIDSPRGGAKCGAAGALHLQDGDVLVAEDAMSEPSTSFAGPPAAGARP